MRQAAVTIQMAWRRSRFGKRVRRRVFDREKREMIARLEQDKFESVSPHLGLALMGKGPVHVKSRRRAATAPAHGGGCPVSHPRHTVRACFVLACACLLEQVRKEYGCDMDEVRLALAAWKAARDDETARGGGEAALGGDALVAVMAGQRRAAGLAAPDAAAAAQVRGVRRAACFA